MEFMIYLADNLWLVLLIAIAIALIIATPIILLRKKRAKDFKESNTTAIIMTTSKKKIGNDDWAAELKIFSINGEKPTIFTIRVVIFACYLLPGKNTIKVRGNWARGRHKMSFGESEVQEITVDAEPGKNYSLEYRISTKEFIFEEYDNPRLFKDDKN